MISTWRFFREWCNWQTHLALDQEIRGSWPLSRAMKRRVLEIDACHHGDDLGTPIPGEPLGTCIARKDLHNITRNCRTWKPVSSRGDIRTKLPVMLVTARFSLDYWEVAHRLHEALSRMRGNIGKLEMSIVGWEIVTQLTEAYPQFDWKNTVLDL